jgi:nitrogen regulatory protein PII
MKSVIALIPPTKLADVKDAVFALGIEMLMVSSVMACGRNTGNSETSTNASSEDCSLNKTRIEVVVSDDLAQRAIDTIVCRSKNGKNGTGILFVADVPQCVRL